jgi:hypothetical protein
MHDVPATFWSLDTPGGPILVAPCQHPESVEEHPDIPLSRLCELHQRTWYWCLDKQEAWCDGGPPEYRWHASDLVPCDHSDTEELAF